MQYAGIREDLKHGNRRKFASMHCREHAGYVAMKKTDPSQPRIEINRRTGMMEKAGKPF